MPISCRSVYSGRAELSNRAGLERYCSSRSVTLCRPGTAIHASGWCCCNAGQLRSPQRPAATAPDSETAHRPPHQSSSGLSGFQGRRCAGTSRHHISFLRAWNQHVAVVPPGCCRRQPDDCFEVAMVRQRLETACRDRSDGDPAKVCRIPARPVHRRTISEDHRSNGRR